MGFFGASFKLKEEEINKLIQVEMGVVGSICDRFVEAFNVAPEKDKVELLVSVFSNVLEKVADKDTRIINCIIISLGYELNNKGIEINKEVIERITKKIKAKFEERDSVKELLDVISAEMLIDEKLKRLEKWNNSLGKPNSHMENSFAEAGDEYIKLFLVKYYQEKKNYTEALALLKEIIDSLKEKCTVRSAAYLRKHVREILGGISGGVEANEPNNEIFKAIGDCYRQLMMACTRVDYEENKERLTLNHRDAIYWFERASRLRNDLAEEARLSSEVDCELINKLLQLKVSPIEFYVSYGTRIENAMKHDDEEKVVSMVMDLAKVTKTENELITLEKLLGEVAKTKEKPYLYVLRSWVLLDVLEQRNKNASIGSSEQTIRKEVARCITKSIELEQLDKVLEWLSALKIRVDKNKTINLTKKDFVDIQNRCLQEDLTKTQLKFALACLQARELAQDLDKNTWLYQQALEVCNKILKNPEARDEILSDPNRFYKFSLCLIKLYQQGLPPNFQIELSTLYAIKDSQDGLGSDNLENRLLGWLLEVIQDHRAGQSINEKNLDLAFECMSFNRYLANNQSVDGLIIAGVKNFIFNLYEKIFNFFKKNYFSEAGSEIDREKCLQFVEKGVKLLNEKNILDAGFKDRLRENMESVRALIGFSSYLELVKHNFDIDFLTKNKFSYMNQLVEGFGEVQDASRYHSSIMAKNSFRFLETQLKDEDKNPISKMVKQLVCYHYLFEETVSYLARANNNSDSKSFCKILIDGLDKQKSLAFDFYFTKLFEKKKAKDIIKLINIVLENCGAANEQSLIERLKELRSKFYNFGQARAEYLLKLAWQDSTGWFKSQAMNKLKELESKSESDPELRSYSKLAQSLLLLGENNSLEDYEFLELNPEKLKAAGNCLDGVIDQGIEKDNILMLCCLQGQWSKIIESLEVPKGWQIAITGKILSTFAAYKKYRQTHNTLWDFNGALQLEESYKKTEGFHVSLINDSYANSSAPLVEEELGREFLLDKIEGQQETQGKLLEQVSEQMNKIEGQQETQGKLLSQVLKQNALLIKMVGEQTAQLAEQKKQLEDQANQLEKQQKQLEELLANAKRQQDSTKTQHSEGATDLPVDPAGREKNLLAEIVLLKAELDIQEKISRGLQEELLVTKEEKLVRTQKPKPPVFESEEGLCTSVPYENKGKWSTYIKLKNI